jgi:8-oxo-dGTP pyrophosphatase MutT (NUDIX family)/RNA:NAD 2'-phosphotransferase (TPT1/KptA family)
VDRRDAQRLTQLARRFLVRMESRVDKNGFVDALTVCEALTPDGGPQVSADQLVAAAHRCPGVIEIRNRSVRLLAPGAVPCTPPDVLYHATNAHGLQHIHRKGYVSSSDDRLVFLSADEPSAWRVAHRAAASTAPTVIYIDAMRARRAGVMFFRSRRGCPYQQAGFGHQMAAGGIPFRRTAGGAFELALIRVARRRGVTWEVAKGKLEQGEPPEVAAVREVREETGYEGSLAVSLPLGRIHYPFVTPDGAPRLKTVFLYLLRAEHEGKAFAPKLDEGVRAVEWFDVEEAIKLVSHTSLRPVMQRVRAELASRADVEEHAWK